MQGASEERIAAFDEHLWTYYDEELCRMAVRGTSDPENQPVFLTTGPENPNRAAVRFLSGRRGLTRFSKGMKHTSA